MQVDVRFVYARHVLGISACNRKRRSIWLGFFFVVSFENRKTRRRSVRRGATVVCHGKKSLSLCFGGGNFFMGLLLDFIDPDEGCRQ